MGLDDFVLIETYIQPAPAVEAPVAASHTDELAEYEAFWYPRPYESRDSDIDISDLEPVDDQDDTMPT